MELQVALNTFATDIFRKQADYDYIAARANWRMGLRQQFLWSALQAVEKYLKAILLFNGKSSISPANSSKNKHFSHDLDALLWEVKSIELFTIDIHREDEEFLSYLSQQGANRYLNISAYNRHGAILELDRLVWHIRRYCQYIPDRGLGCHEAVAGFQEAVLRKITDSSKKETPHSSVYFQGELEGVIKRAPKDPARQALVWMNQWFGQKKRNQVTYKLFDSSETAPCDRKWQDSDWALIKDYVKLR